MTEIIGDYLVSRGSSTIGWIFPIEVQTIEIVFQKQVC